MVRQDLDWGETAPGYRLQMGAVWMEVDAAHRLNLWVSLRPATAPPYCRALQCPLHTHPISSKLIAAHSSASWRTLHAT